MEPTGLARKKGQKSGKTKKKNSKNKKPSSSRKSNKTLQGGTDLSAKLLCTIEKHKEVGTVVFVVEVSPWEGRR